MRGWYIEALVIAASVSAGQFIANNIDQKKNERQNNIWKHEMRQKWIASILKILIPTEVLSIHQGPRRSLWDKMKLRPHKQEKNQGWLKNLVLFTHYDNMMHTLPSLTSSLSSLFDLPTQFGDKYYDKKNSSWLVWYSGCIADPVFSVKPLKLWTIWLTRDTQGRYLERISLSFNPCLKNIRVGTIVSCVHKIEALTRTKFGEGWLRWCI